MADDTRLDSRYDPAFQRGYAPTDDAGGPVVTSAARGSSLTTPVSTRAPGVVAAVPAGDPRAIPASRIEVPPFDAGRPPAGAGLVDEKDDDQFADAEVGTGAHRGVSIRNPFVIALIVLSAALVVAAVAWAASAIAIVRDGVSDELTFWMQSWAGTGVPIVGGFGIAIAAGVLFLFAARRT